MMGKPTDEWETPQWLFDKLNAEFKFDLDVCATDKNTKCKNFCIDALRASDWGSENEAFMNPPYSTPKPFVEMAYSQSKFRKIVCLLKVDPSTTWWAIFWDHELHKPRPGIEIRYLPRRLKFDVPKNLRRDKKYNGPTFPTCIVIMDRRNNE